MAKDELKALICWCGRECNYHNSPPFFVRLSCVCKGEEKRAAIVYR